MGDPIFSARDMHGTAALRASGRPWGILCCEGDWPVVTASDIVKKKREEILAIASKHGASNVRVFGSVARGEADETSDIDLLVDLDRGRTLFDLAALVEELNQATGWRVDVVTEGGLRERIHDVVLHEAVAL
jgi:predicted nucleotidyltransferase